MAQTAYPKVGGSTTDVQFREMFQQIVDSGVTASGGLLVSGDSSGMNVKVATGMAFIEGIAYKSTAIETLAIGTAPGAGQSRIDTVALKLDYTLTPIVQLTVVAGSAASTGSQVAPALTPAGNVQAYLALADVAVGPSVVTITAGNVTDRRTFVGSNVGTWSSSTRPAAPTKRTLGFNTTTNLWEGWNGAGWVAISLNPTTIGTALISAANVAAARAALDIVVQLADPGHQAGRVWIKTVS
jgi:hypothetical protein